MRILPLGERGHSEARTEGAQFSLRVGRLRRLEQMGLAEEKRTGVWAMDPQLETKLRSLGERGDIMVIMNQVMRAHGIDRPAGDFAIFSGSRKSEPVIGRVVEVGIADEMSDRKYLIVDARLWHVLPTGGVNVALRLPKAPTRGSTESRGSSRQRSSRQGLSPGSNGKAAGLQFRATRPTPFLKPAPRGRKMAKPRSRLFVV